MAAVNDVTDLQSWNTTRALISNSEFVRTNAEIMLFGEPPPPVTDFVGWGVQM